MLATLGTASLAAVPAFADSVTTPGALQVTQTTGGPAVVNQPINFTITVTNTTSRLAGGIALGDLLPQGMTVVNLLGPGGNPDLCARTQGGGRARATGFSCSMGDLAPGASATLSFTGTPTVVGPTTNTAVAQGCTGLPAPLPAGLPCPSAPGIFVTTTSRLPLQVLASVPAPIPATVPAAPSAVTATAGDAQATVSWTVPANDGGSPITSYTVTSSPATAPVIITAPATSAVVTGLTDGTSYTFTVTATNSVGTGAASAPSNSVTPVAPVAAATVPGAPTAVTATAGDAQASVSWTAPASDGGSPITSYTITSSPAVGAPISVAAPATSAVVTGLTNGSSYTFTVTATNAVGTGAASAPSNSATPAAPVPPVPTATVPDAPTGATATAGDAQATVSWTAPANDGGSAITSYTVTSSPATAPVTVAAPATSAVVTGLTDGTSYTFTVTATNSVGTGAASAPSNSVTPAAPVTGPAPTDVQVAGAATTGQPTAGGLFGYVFQVKNNGSATASNIQFTDVLPAGETFVAANPGCTNNAGVVTCQIPSLARGASAILAIAVKAPTAPGTYTAAATVTEANPDTRPSNNSVGVTIQVR